MEYSPLLVLAVVIIFLLIFLLSGMPVAFAFLIMNVIGLYIFLGGPEAWHFLVLSTQEILTNFEMLAVVFFILMGEILSHLGLMRIVFDNTERLTGFIPARLSFVVIIVSTVWAALSGSSIATCAVLGSTIAPEMKQRGYKNPIILGPIMGGAVLDMLIPPSAFAVLLATMSHISAGKVLMGGTGPGILLSVIFFAYILIKVLKNPDLAPIDKPPAVSTLGKAMSVIRLIPLVSIFFMTMGTIFLGIATPTEASALGTLGVFIAAGIYRKLSWRGTLNAILESGKIASTIFLIMMTSKCFSQFLAGTGILGTILETVGKLNLPVWTLVSMMQFVVLVMGMFLDGFSILMITIPIYMPILNSIGYDPLLFAILYLMSLGVGLLSPPFGMVLYVMKSVSGPDVSMEDIFRAAIPYALLMLLGIVIVAILPQIAVWLPNRMIR